MIEIYQISKCSKRSTVTGGGVFDVGLSTWLLGSLPEDLVANLGESPLTFEVSARSDLEVVVVSVAVSGLDDLSFNLLNESFQGFQISMFEASNIEVNFKGFSEVPDIRFGEAVILVEIKDMVLFKVLDMGSHNTVEVTKIVTDVISSHGELTVDTVFDLGNSVFEFVFSIVSSTVNLVGN